MTIDKRAAVDKDAQVDPSASVGPFAVIGAGVTIGAETEVQAHCVISGPTTIGEKNVIGSFSTLGGDPQDISYKGEPTELIIGNNNKIREYVSIHRGTVNGLGKTTIGDNNMIMGYSHIAHDCQIGNHIVLTNLSTLAGHIEVRDRAYISGMVGLHQFCRVGEYSFIGGMSGIGRDVPPYVIVTGIRSRVRVTGLNKIGLKRNGFKKETIKRIDSVFRILYRSDDLLYRDALAKAKEAAIGCSEAELFVQFFEDSKRGVIRTVEG